MQKSNSNGGGSDIFTMLVGGFFAFFIVIAMALWLKVFWPLIKFLAKKVWTAVMKRFGGTKTEKEEKQIEELPTPEIFKDAKNLARAKELSF